MKVRYATPCARCTRPMRQGEAAVRHAGGLWHPQCLIDYKQRRFALREPVTTRK